MGRAPGEADEKIFFPFIKPEEENEKSLLKFNFTGDHNAEKTSMLNEPWLNRELAQNTIEKGEEEEAPKEKDQINFNRPLLPFMQQRSDPALPSNYAFSNHLPEKDQVLPTHFEDPQGGMTLRGKSTSLYTKRLVEKNGSSNVKPRSSKRHRFLNDFYTTLSDLKWRYCLLILILVHVSSWIAFAMMYYAVVSIHQDVINGDNPDWDSCIQNVDSFVSSFLFSLETQTTIGYGFRAMKGVCPVAVVVWKIQSLMNILLTSLFCGLIFAKFMSPRYRSKLIKFSRRAVITSNRGVPSFIFRIIDLKESNLVKCNVKAVLIRERVTKEGEFIPFYNRSLSLSIEETTGSDLFLVWSVNVIHVIDSQSPLYGLTPKLLQDEYLEIIVILEGVVENTGKLMQVRTSYVSDEIFWNASFSPMLTFNPRTNAYEMDYSHFDLVQLTGAPAFLPPCRPRFHHRRSDAASVTPTHVKQDVKRSSQRSVNNHRRPVAGPHRIT